MDLRRLRERFQRFVTDPGQELGRMARFVRFQVQWWRFCARRLSANNVMAMSAALSFRTIFALIPALVLAFLVAKSLGVVDDSKKGMRKFLDASGFSQIVALQEPQGDPPPLTPEDIAASPAKVINLADEIESIVTSVEGKLTFQRLGPIGGALLVWTALTLITTLERSLNRIFGASRDRSVPRRVLMYWSVMTLGPIVLAIASFYGNRAVKAFQGVPVMSWIATGVGWLGPALVGVLVLSAVYMLLPNTAVSSRAAAGGALVAVVLWMAAKWAFSLYVKRWVVQGNLYGLLGVFPLFMMWLNFSWLIVLFGAELAHTAAHIGELDADSRERSPLVSPLDALAVALAVAQRFDSGAGALPLGRIAAEAALPDRTTGWLLERLSARGIVCATGSPPERGYVLARPAERIPLTEVLSLAEPRSGTASTNGDADSLSTVVAAIGAKMQAPISDVSLADLLRTGVALHDTDRHGLAVRVE